MLSLAEKGRQARKPRLATKHFDNLKAWSVNGPAGGGA
jgi:hypothetical protein